MTVINQEFTFDCAQAITALNQLTTALNSGNAALANFAKASKALSGGGGGGGSGAAKQAKEIGMLSKAYSGLKSVISSIGIERAISQAFNVQALASAVEEARKFGQAINEIQTIGQSLNQSNAEITAGILELSSALGKSAQDVAEGLYQVLSNQVVEAADAMTFLAEAEKLAITTHATTAQSVDALSSVMNSYSLGIEDMSRVSSVLFETVNLGRLRLDEIADRIGRITPMAAQMGVSFEEVGAAIAVMTVQGVKADTAITQLRAIMSKLLKPTEALSKVFKSWGVADGKEALATFGGLSGVLQKLAAETGGSSAEMAEFFNVVRAMTGQFALATDGGKKFEEAIKKMEVAAGTNKALSAWETFAESDSQQLTQQITTVKNSFLELGNALLPVVVNIGEGFGSWFDHLSEGLTVLGGVESVVRAMDAAENKRIKEIADVESKNRQATSFRTKFDSKGYKDAESSLRQLAATAGVAFNQMTTQVNSRLKSSSIAFLSGMDDVIEGYKVGYESLTKFVEGAHDKLKDTGQTIKDLKATIEGVKFDREFKAAGSDFKRLDLLTSRANRFEQSGIDQGRRAGVNEDARESADAALDAALAENRRAQSLAESAGWMSKVKELQSQEDRILQSKLKNQEQFQQQIQSTLPVAKNLKEQLDFKVASLSEFKTQLDSAVRELVQGKATGKLTADQETQLKQTISGLLRQIGQVDFGKEINLLSKLNLPNTLQEVEAGMSKALGVSAAKWKQDLQSAQKLIGEEFSKTMAKVDPSGELKKLFDALGLKPDPNLGPAGAMSLAFDKAEELLLKVDELNEELARADTAIKENSQSKIDRRNNELQSMADAVGARANTPEKLAAFTEQVRVLLNARAQIQELFNAATEGKLGEEDIAKQGEALAQYINRAEEAKTITERQAEVLRQQVGIIQDRNKAENAKKDVTATLEELSPQKSAAAEFIRYAETQGRLSKLTADSATIVKDSAAAAAESLATGSQSTKQIAIDFAAVRRDAEAAEQAIARAAEAEGAAGGKYFGGMQYLHSGGPSRGGDRVPSMLAPGEFVTNANNTRKFFSELNAMNQGIRPVYRERGGAVTNVGDVNITVKGGDSAQSTVREIGQSLRREIQRGIIKLK